MVRSYCNNLQQMGAQVVGEIRCWVESEAEGMGLTNGWDVEYGRWRYVNFLLEQL